MRLRFNRINLLPVAREIEQRITGPYALVGSWRRERKTVSDLNIMVQPPLERSAARLMATYKRVASRRAWAHAVLTGPTDLDIVLYVVAPENWGAALVFYTGHTFFVGRLCHRAREMGMRLCSTGLFDAGGRIAGRHEEQIFNILGLPFFPPSKRHNSAPFPT